MKKLYVLLLGLVLGFSSMNTAIAMDFSCLGDLLDGYSSEPDKEPEADTKKYAVVLTQGTALVAYNKEKEAAFKAEMARDKAILKEETAQLEALKLAMAGVVKMKARRRKDKRQRVRAELKSAMATKAKLLAAQRALGAAGEESDDSDEE